MSAKECKTEDTMTAMLLGSGFWLDVYRIEMMRF
jgi:hypothetical protein